MQEHDDTPASGSGGPDWERFLEFEVERRERRQRYLWTILVALLVSLYGLVRQVLAADVPHGMSLPLAFALGALGYLMVLAPIFQRFTELVAPQQMHLFLNPRQMLSIVDALHGLGLNARSRVVHLPEVLGRLLLAIAIAWLLVGTRFAWAGWSLMGLIFFAALVRAIPVFGPPRFIGASFASLVLGWYRQTGLDEAVRQSYSAELERLEEGSWGGSRLSAPGAARMHDGVMRWTTTVGKWSFRTLLGLALGLVIWQAGELVSGSDYTSVSPVVGLAAIISLVLVTLRLGLILYGDSTGELLEQLRFGTMTRHISPQSVPLIFAGIEALQKSHIFTNLPLMVVVHLTGIARTIAEQTKLEEFDADRQDDSSITE